MNMKDYAEGKQRGSTIVGLLQGEQSITTWLMTVNSVVGYVLQFFITVSISQPQHSHVAELMGMSPAAVVTPPGSITS
jgi:hypothetical protein